MANHYTDTHSGIRYSQIQIDTNLSKSKRELRQDQIDEHGYQFCEQCKHEYETKGIIPPKDLEHTIIDCSHIKSVKQCKWENEIELIWNKKNMKLLCRKHHSILDGLILQWTS